MTHFCWYPTVTIISYSILLLFFIIIIITIIKLISHAPGFRTSPIYCFPLWKLCPCAPFPYYLVISSNLTLMTEQTYVSVCLVFSPSNRKGKTRCFGRKWRCYGTRCASKDLLRVLSYRPQCKELPFPLVSNLIFSSPCFHSHLIPIHSLQSSQSDTFLSNQNISLFLRKLFIATP